MITKQGKFYVYEHLLDDIVFYVGSGNWYRPNRFDNRTASWWNYVKDRQNDVKVTVINEFETKEEAYQFEVEWSIKRRNQGYPIVGQIGHKHTEEWKKVHSEQIRGNTYRKGKTNSTEMNRKISEGIKRCYAEGRAKKRNSSGFKNKHHTKEAKTKIGNASRGRKMSEETKRKISETIKKKFNKGEL